MYKPFPFFLFLIIVLGSFSFVYAQTYSITVESGKMNYYANEYIENGGTAKLDGISVTNALVGLLVKSPDGDYKVMRAVNTGSEPPYQAVPTVRAIIASDLAGEPVNSFYAGGDAYFKVTVSNLDNVGLPVLTVITAFDSQNNVIGHASLETFIDGRATESYILSIPLPSYTSNGNAKIYGAAYSDWLDQGGYPYSPEKTCEVEITGGITQSGSYQPTYSGDFNIFYRLDKSYPQGIYQVTATSKHNGLIDTAQTSFQWKILGDFDLDGDVDFSDIISFVDMYINFGKTPSIYDPRGDFNNDSQIDFNDLIMLVDSYVYIG